MRHSPMTIDLPSPVDICATKALKRAFCFLGGVSTICDWKNLHMSSTVKACVWCGVSGGYFLSTIICIHLVVTCPRVASESQ